MKKKQTKRIFQIILLVGTITSMFFVPWILVRALIAPITDTIQEQVDKEIKYGFDGMIVYVDQAGKPPAFYAAGWKNREKKIPADPNTLFKIASISKLYVAVAVAKLVNDKHLALDKTLADYTPDFWEHSTKDNGKTLELVLDKPADFEPDKKYSYSNTNYLLIGEILDKTLGYSHHQYIKREILKPLGLNNTHSLLSEVDIDSVMSGYDVGYDGDLKYNDFINSAGSMVATAEDVGIFLRALNDGSLLNDNEQAIYSSIYKYEHTGLLPGYSSIAKYHKDIDAVVIQFVNTSGGYSWNLSEIVYNRIIKILKSKKSSQ